MWLLELPQPGMLFRGLLYFMRSVSARCLLTNHVRSSLWGTPCLLANDSHPQVSYPPKLAIKTNLACGEIKPSLAEEWHQLQVSHCAFCTLLSITPPLSFTLSLPPFLSATNSNSPLSYEFLPDPPPAPHCRWMCGCQKRGLPQYGYCAHWTFICMGAWSPLANSIVQLLMSSQNPSLSSDFHLSQRAIC